jgi:hypothetical protein
LDSDLRPAHWAEALDVLATIELMSYQSQNPPHGKNYAGEIFSPASPATLPEDNFSDHGEDNRTDSEADEDDDNDARENDDHELGPLASLTNVKPTSTASHAEIEIDVTASPPPDVAPMAAAFSIMPGMTVLKPPSLSPSPSSSCSESPSSSQLLFLLINGTSGKPSDPLDSDARHKRDKTHKKPESGKDPTFYLC